MINPNNSGFIDDNPLSGMIQPDTKEPVMGTVPEYINSEIDLVSGKPMSVLETGICPENDLGDVAPLPHPLEISDIPGDKNNVGG